MANSRRKQVLQAIQQIRAFHQMGRESVRERSGRGTYRDRAIDQEAEARELNADAVRKMRQFADPEAGYTPDELSELCRMIKTVQVDQDEHEGIFNRTHVIRLLTVRPKRRRAKLQTEAIEQGWTCAELEAEIARRFGTRRHGGRRRRVARGEAELMTQIERMCEEWRRWHEELTRLLKEGDQEKEPVLSAKVRRQVDDASEQLLGLQKTVVGQLGKIQPDRELRYAFKEKDAPSQNGTSRKRSRSK